MKKEILKLEDIHPDARQALAEVFSDLDDPEVQADLTLFALIYARVNTDRRAKLLAYGRSLMADHIADHEVERQMKERDRLRGFVQVKGGEA